MQEKEIEVDWNGTKAKVVLKKLNYGERNDCLRKATVINPISQSASLDVYTFNEMRLVKALRTAPFPINLESVRSLDPQLADMIIKEIDTINELDAEKSKNLLSPSTPSALSEAPK